MACRYRELSVAVPDDAAEGLTNFLWELGALGVVEEERPGEAPRLRGFFADGLDNAALCARVDAYVDGLRALGFAGGGATAVHGLVDDGWAEAWRAHFTPRAVGRALLVAPPWASPDPEGRHVLLIEPGRAFGTGQHGSTAGCLELLEDVIGRARPARAIDVGTGSGILAIAAARLGVRDVLAIDTDPDAVRSAAANVERNALGARVRCTVADVATLEAPPAPLLLANLLAAAHHQHAGRYARLVSRGGTLIAGGVLDAERAAVADALAAHGFRARGARSLEGWTTLAVTRDAALHSRA